MYVGGLDVTHQFARGVISASMLPFESNGAIDWPTFDRYIARVAEGRPQAIALNMDASEGTSLSVDEQLQVVVRAKKVLGNSCPLISGLLTNYTALAVDISKKFVDLGVNIVGGCCGTTPDYIKGIVQAIR